MAITVKVYGRLSAKRTIHISASQSFRADKVCVEQSRHALLPVSLGAASLALDYSGLRLRLDFATPAKGFG
jgi:hypothetical protein